MIDPLVVEYCQFDGNRLLSVAKGVQRLKNGFRRRRIPVDPVMAGLTLVWRVFLAMYLTYFYTSRGNFLLQEGIPLCVKARIPRRKYEDSISIVVLSRG